MAAILPSAKTVVQRKEGLGLGCEDLWSESTSTGCSRRPGAGEPCGCVVSLLPLLSFPGAAVTTTECKSGRHLDKARLSHGQAYVKGFAQGSF